MSNAAEDHPKIGFPPLALPVLALLVAAILDAVAPVSFLPGVTTFGWPLAAGVLLVIVGALIAFSALRLFWKSGTNSLPHKETVAIVTDGVYRFSRNPMYVSFLVLQTGLALAFSLEWGLLLVPVVFVALDRLVIAKEERYLSAKFGAPYLDYMKTTRRWL